MELDNLDKLFVEKATMTTVLETHQPNDNPFPTLLQHIKIP